MDTVTLTCSAIGGVLAACEPELKERCRAVLERDDDYASSGKPVCDWEHRSAREQLVDALARDARAMLRVLDGQELEPVLAKAGELLGTVVGQDLQIDGDGRFWDRTPGREGPGDLDRGPGRTARVLSAV